jgi:hypothetical protein
LKEKGVLGDTYQARVLLGLDGNPKFETDCVSWDLKTMQVKKVRKRLRWFDYIPDLPMQRVILRELRSGYNMNPNVPPFGVEDFQRTVDVYSDRIEFNDVWYEEEMRCDVPR